MKKNTHSVASCWAFVGLHLLSSPAAMELGRQERIIFGAAYLLGLLIEKAQSRELALENELRLLRLIRVEDAKANEKVVSIFSSHEQAWVAERKRLNLQIRALTTQLQSLRSKNEEIVSSLNYRIAEAECEIQTKDRIIDQEMIKNKEAFSKLETAKQEAEKMVDKLSDEIAKSKNDVEQKEKMLSALVRKSKLDAVEKQMMLKELKISKAKGKQAELEMEKWRNKWESRHKKGARSSFSVEAECSQEKMEDLQAQRSQVGSKNLLLDYFASEWGREKEILNEIGTDDIENLRNWVRMETEKYATLLEQKHFAEIEAFTVQMRLKDEKLEAFRWRLLSKDMESKRLISQVEVLEENLLQLREETYKLEARLLDREAEIRSLKDQFGFFVHHCQKNSSKMSPAYVEMTKQIDMEREVEVDSASRNQQYGDQMVNYITEINFMDSPLSSDYSVGNSPICIHECIDSYGEKGKRVSLITNSPNQEIEEEKDVVHVSLQSNTYKEGDIAINVPPAAKSTPGKESSRKVDIHALGVSYKIKRLKHQLLMLEKLAGMKQTMITGDAQDSPNDKKADENKQHLKGITLVIHLISKQVKRFQSLEQKTDDLCTKMHESAGAEGRKENSRLLEGFLEETFQLQRYMVATGQKLIDIQSKIASSIRDGDGLDQSIGFNMLQFGDVIRSLLTDIQRGLEVRISRIIGDLEGTLACDGIRHM